MTTMTNTCPICEEGQLTAHVGINEVKYQDIVKEIPSHYSLCNFCETEQSDSQQLRQNKREMLSFKKSVDGLLSGSEIKKFRTFYQVTQAQAAKIFGGGPVAFSKYEHNDVAQSEPMDNLLRVCRVFPEAFDWLASYAGVNIERSSQLDEKLVAIFSGSLTKGNYLTPARNRSYVELQGNPHMTDFCSNDEFESKLMWG